MKIHRKEIIVSEYDFAELSESQQTLIQKLKVALPNAYAPYSNFPVSTALLLQNGEIITGTNQENAAYPSGLCAERVALFYKGSQYPDQPISKLAVTVGNNTPDFPYPCGACLQVISEFTNRQAEPFEIILYHLHLNKALIASGVKQLMPFAFIKEHLGKL